MPTYIFSDYSEDAEEHNGWSNTIIIHADTEKRARSILKEKYDENDIRKAQYTEYIKDFPNFLKKYEGTTSFSFWQDYVKEKGPPPSVEYLPDKETMKLVKVLIDESYFIAEAEE